MILDPERLKECKSEDIQYAALLFVDFMETKGYVFNPDINEKLVGRVRRISLQVSDKSIALLYPELSACIVFAEYRDDKKHTMIVIESTVYYTSFPEDDNDYSKLIETIFDPEFHIKRRNEQKALEEEVAARRKRNEEEWEQYQIELEEKKKKDDERLEEIKQRTKKILQEQTNELKMKSKTKK